MNYIANTLNANESASKANENTNSNSNAMNANDAIDANVIHSINTSISSYSHSQISCFVI